MSARAAAAALLLAACSSVPFARDAMQAPLAAAGDAARGREVFVTREAGHCVLCHEVPGAAAFGNVGPSLAGVGSRLTVPQLRLRVADITRVDADAVMPTFHRVEGMTRVASQYQGKPVLTGQQVEDVVAYLASLR